MPVEIACLYVQMMTVTAVEVLRQTLCLCSNLTFVHIRINSYKLPMRVLSQHTVAVFFSVLSSKTPQANQQPLINIFLDAKCYYTGHSLHKDTTEIIRHIFQYIFIYIFSNLLTR